MTTGFMRPTCCALVLRWRPTMQVVGCRISIDNDSYYRQNYDLTQANVRTAWRSDNLMYMGLLLRNDDRRSHEAILKVDQ
jgi:hypothetical protein